MGDRQRKVAFVGAALSLLVITSLLAFGEPGRRPGPHAQPSAVTTAIRTGRPPSKSGSMQTPGSASPHSVSQSRGRPARGAGRGEREARSAPAVAPDAAAGAERAARAFLVGYLPYSYGRARAKRIRAAAWRLMHELERTTPRVPAAIARANPRLLSVRAEATLGDDAIAVVAVVDDGPRRYSVPLELRPTGGHWAVTAIGG